jgi:hypothetical protein
MNRKQLQRSEVEAVMYLTYSNPDQWGRFKEYLQRMYDIAKEDMETNPHDLGAYRTLQGECAVLRKLLQIEETAQKLLNT